MKLLKSAKSLLTKAYRNGYVQMILLWLALDVACSAGHRLERESLSPVLHSSSLPLSSPESPMNSGTIASTTSV